MKKLLLFFCLLILTACARPVAQPPEVPSDSIWQKMLEASAHRQGPYRMQLSMRVGEEGNTRRVTGILWSNGDSDIRLDVMAGVGATIAKISENGREFLVYTPRDNKAYSHTGDNRPMLKIGVPAPFDLATLAELLNGNYAAAFGNSFVSAEPLANGNTDFRLDGQLAGTIQLNSDGMPVAWKQDNGAWQMRIAQEEENPELPKSLRLSNNKGQMAIILVKEREQIATPFEANQLKLTIPAGIEMLPLSKFRQPQG